MFALVKYKIFRRENDNSVIHKNIIKPSTQFPATFLPSSKACSNNYTGCVFINKIRNAHIAAFPVQASRVPASNPDTKFNGTQVAKKTSCRMGKSFLSSCNVWSYYMPTGPNARARLRDEEKVPFYYISIS